MGVLTRGNFRFLYRETEGEIDRAVWWTASLPLIVAFALLAAIWIAVAPRQPRDLGNSQLVDPKVIAIYVYAVAAALAGTLLLVMEYCVSAKRFRFLGLPGSLAGLAPLAALVAGAAHWVAARAEGGVPGWIVLAIDVCALAIVLGSVAVLGVLPERAARR